MIDSKHFSVTEKAGRRQITAEISTLQHLPEYKANVHEITVSFPEDQETFTFESGDVRDGEYVGWWFVGDKGGKLLIIND